MFIQDFYLGLDGKQRIVVLSALGGFACLMFCCVLWIFSSGQAASSLNEQERVAMASGETIVGRSQATANAASLAAPTSTRNEIIRAGLAQGSKQSTDLMQSRSRNKEALQAYRQATSEEVKAALIPGFARRQDYEAMPLILQAITSDNVILSGRAVATAQHLLGVRYENSISQLKDPNFRKQIADMVLEDWQHLQKYPKFKENIGS